MVLAIEVERRVGAPVDAVWATVSAIDRYPEVVTSYVRLEYLTAQTAGVGTRWRQTRRVFGREHAQELSVVAWEPPAHLVTVAREAGATYRTTWRLVPDGEGTTSRTSPGQPSSRRAAEVRGRTRPARPVAGAPGGIRTRSANHRD